MIKRKKKLSTNHPWVYEGEILEVQGNIENGDLIDVFSANGNTYLGSGFSQVCNNSCQIISKNANDRFDRAFYERRIAHALDYRKSVMGEDFTNCRLILEKLIFPPDLPLIASTMFWLPKLPAWVLKKSKKCFIAAAGLF